LTVSKTTDYCSNYEVYFAHKSPNPGSKDGDLHFAGFDKKIGLPIVAEIMNAKNLMTQYKKS
jgi:hypothetical protein